MSLEQKKVDPGEIALSQSYFEICRMFHFCSAISVHMIVITALVMKERDPKGIRIKKKEKDFL